MKNSFLSGMDLGCRAYNVEGQRRMFCVKEEGHDGPHEAIWWIEFREDYNPLDKFERMPELIPGGPRTWAKKKAPAVKEK